MKSLPTNLLFLTLGIVSLSAASVFAEEAKAEIEWVDSEDFRDIDRQWNSSKRDHEIVLKQLDEMFTDVVERRFPDGYTVKLKFTDVDLEGEFEPIGRPGFDEVRIVKDLYPARLDFSYTVTDANGEVVKEGEAKLRSTPMMHPVTSNRYPYPHTRDIFDDWARRMKVK